MISDRGCWKCRCVCRGDLRSSGWADPWTALGASGGNVEEGAWEGRGVWGSDSRDAFLLSALRRGVCPAADLALRGPTRGAAGVTVCGGTAWGLGGLPDLRAEDGMCSAGLGAGTQGQGQHQRGTAVRRWPFPLRLSAPATLPGAVSPPPAWRPGALALLHARPLLCSDPHGRKPLSIPTGSASRGSPCPSASACGHQVSLWRRSRDLGVGEGLARGGCCWPRLALSGMGSLCHSGSGALGPGKA